nr:replication factor C large subunit [Caldisphaera lagunensis]
MSNEVKIPWIIKYRPKRVDDIINQEEAKSQMLTWIHSWLEGKRPEKKALLLYGPPGVGKTSLVEAIANEYDLELLELNASDYRRTQDIKKTVANASQKRPLFKKMILILMDEIDGLSPRGDIGGVDELIKIIPNTMNPIILTANDPWKDNLRPIREYVSMVEFKPLTLNQVISVLQGICNKENLECEREALKFIAEKSMGDLRGAINDLEAVAEGYGKVTFNLVSVIVKGRDKSVDLWRTLNGVFYAKEAWQSRRSVMNSEEDYETLIAWFNDNVPLKYGDYEDLFRAMDSLSRASLFLKRAKSGDWDMLSYVFDLIGPGITYARKNGEILKNRFSYPQKIKIMGQMKSLRETRDRIAKILSERTLSSQRVIKSDVIQYLITIFRNGNIERVAMIARAYGFSEDDLKYLAGNRYKDIEKEMDRLREGKKEEINAKEKEVKKQTSLEFFGVKSSQVKKTEKGKRKYYKKDNK